MQSFLFSSETPDSLAECLVKIAGGEGLAIAESDVWNVLQVDLVHTPALVVLWQQSCPRPLFAPDVVSMLFGIYG